MNNFNLFEFKRELTNSKKLQVHHNHTNNLFYFEQEDKRQKHNNSICTVEVKEGVTPFIISWLKKKQFNINFDNLYYIVSSEIDLLIDKLNKKEFIRLASFINDIDLIINEKALLYYLNDNDNRCPIYFLENWKEDMVKYYYMCLFYFDKVQDKNNYYELYGKEFFKEIDKQHRREL